jgi:Tfp pilus assembly protein PilZ
MELPDGPPVATTGRVVWCKRMADQPSEADFGMGIEFTDTAADRATRLDQALAPGGHQPLHDMLLEYARLEKRRSFDGLSAGELKGWVQLKRTISPLVNPEWDPHRQQQRQSIRVPSQIRCSFSEPQSGLVTMLSTSGVFVATENPEPIGTRVLVRLESEEDGATLEVPGVVVSHNIRPSGERAAGMGVKFVDVSPEKLKRIFDLYERTIRREFSGQGEESESPSRRH